MKLLIFSSNPSSIHSLLCVVENMSSPFKSVLLQYHRTDLDFIGFANPYDIVMIELSSIDDLPFLYQMQERYSNLIILGLQQNFSLLKNTSLSQFFVDANNNLAIKSVIQKYIDKNKIKPISKTSRHQDSFFIDTSCNTLTDHQVELLKTISKGFLYKEIAEKFSISEGTVKQHLHKIYNKLNVANKVEAINKLAMM